jgi:hypothetical protein
MVRKYIRAGLFAALGILAVTFAAGATASPTADDKLPTISEIMKKGHTKTDGYIDLIKVAVKGEKWEDAEKYAKTLEAFGEALGKNKPPKGEADSWEKLTKKYAENTKLVLKGTEDKDAKAVAKGLGGINCGECHKAHK